MSLALNWMSPEFIEDPYPFYAQLRGQRVARVEPGGMWCLLGYDEIVAALKDPKSFSSAVWTEVYRPAWLERNPLADSMGVKDPPAHTRIRHLVNHAFTPTAISRMETWVKPIAERIAERAVGLRQLDYLEDIATPMCASVIGQMLGLDEALHPELKNWTSALMEIPAPQHTPERIEWIRKSVKQMEDGMAAVVEARRREPREDLVTDMLNARGANGDSLSQDEIVSSMFTLLIAGFDTTVATLANNMTVLVRFPQVFEQLRKDPSLVSKFLDEALRYEPSGHISFRRAVKATEVAGTLIPEGAIVLLAFGSANRDERYFADSEQFILERKENKTLAFGYGVHHCLGASLARLIARTSTEALLTRISGFTLEHDRIPWAMSAGKRAPKTLRMHLKPIGET